MKKVSSLRHEIRRIRLGLAIEETGGATALAKLIGTPKTHISAMVRGTRGMGDALAAKIERKLEKPAGWMDVPMTAEPSTSYGPAGVDLDDTDRAMLAIFRVYPTSKRRKIIEQLKEESAEFVEMTAEITRRLTKNGRVEPSEPDIAPKPSTPPAARARFSYRANPTATTAPAGSKKKA